MPSKEAEAVTFADARSEVCESVQWMVGLNISPHESLIGLRVIATATAKETVSGSLVRERPTN